MVDHLVEEVDADLRADRLVYLWRRYRTTLYVVIGTIIFATAANSIRQYYVAKEGGARLAALRHAEQLLVEGKHADSAAAFETIAANSSGDTATLARVWQARAWLAAKQPAKAIPLLKDASTGENVWSDIACLRLAALDAAAAKPCLARNNDSPLLNTRREWHAAEQWASGDSEGAITTLEALSTSPDTSDTLRNRANAWLATLRAQKATR